MHSRRAASVPIFVSPLSCVPCISLGCLATRIRGTLNVASDLSTGGCESVDDLAKRWTKVGFLLGFEVGGTRD